MIPKITVNVLSVKELAMPWGVEVERWLRSVKLVGSGTTSPSKIQRVPAPSSRRGYGSAPLS